MDKESIFRKLKFNPNAKNLIVNAPSDYTIILQDALYDVSPSEEKQGQYDFVQVFASSQAEMETLVTSVVSEGKFDCIFWACYPKSTGKQKYDLKRETVWYGFELCGLRAVSQVAINEKWSALRARDAKLVKG